MKAEIVELLGQSDVLLPSLISQGLLANDRVKARLSVLQAAGAHARNPEGVRFDLTEECRAVGIDAVAMETLVNHANLVADDRVTSPGLDNLTSAIWADMTAMNRAVTAGNPAEGESAAQRLTNIKQNVACKTADSIALADIAKLTALSNGNADSLHHVVVDLHKALNELAAAHAEEVLAGAHVSGLLPEDRPAVEAFMKGVNLTKKLKFNHPGLSTTAARSGRRLTIQNDIGETDAHVVIVTVEEDEVTLTYTDIHIARAKFFTDLFRDFPVHWSGLDRKSAEGLGDEGVFYLVTGRYPFDHKSGRDKFLEAIGASLVFLIDWNKARKLLRTLLPKSDAVRVLDWAARHRIGHRGFLELGGGDLLASAVHNSVPARIGFGERLDHALGREAAVDLIKSALRISTEALLEGGSVRLARDRIEAELVRHLQRVDARLLAIVVRQAGLAREIAVGLAHCVAEQQASRKSDRAALAVRARRIEEKADKIVIEARNEIARFEADPAIERFVNRVEDAIDELEQAAFIASLVPSEIDPVLLAPLADLCAAAVAGAEAAAKGITAASDLPEGHHADSEDALSAVDRLIEAEHKADTAERAVTATILRDDFDLKSALSVLELARSIERATDRFAGFGHLLRERVLAELAA